jgi:hypothetical protein
MPLRPTKQRRALLLALALVAAACLQPACKQEPVAERDRDIILRVADLADYGIKFQDAARYEKFEKLRYFDGSYELTYEFELPDAATRADAVYMQVLASVEKDESGAALSQGGEKIGFGFGMKLEGIHAEERKNFFRYGDHSAFFVLVKDGQPIGNYFSTRFGVRVYSILVAGVYFDDPAAWSALVTPKLEKFAAYQP